MAFLAIDGGKGRELADLLQRELNIPEGVKWFEVRFAVDEALTVKCEFFAQEREAGEPK